MENQNLNFSLEKILSYYSHSFSAKIFSEESQEVDDLMKVFGLTQQVKVANKQYWGRELGMCWQKLITELCRHSVRSFSGPIRLGADEICDLVLNKDAIDTKYRIGSGDSGTLKKFKQYGHKLKERNYKPILLILRTDNLPAAITACNTGGWESLIKNDAYSYLKEKTGFDLKKWLKNKVNFYKITN